VFKEVVKPERIVFSHGGNREGGPDVRFVATWTFDVRDGDKTEVTIRMEFPSAEERDFVIKQFGALEGGKQTLARLSEHLPTMPFVIERTFDAPVKTVWQAITELDQMKQWYFPMLEAFKPEVGFQTQFTVSFGNTDYLHIWKVAEVVPQKRIAYRWKYGGYPGDSLVTFELFDEAGKTRLKLTHEGLETFEPQTYPVLSRKNFAMGWIHFVETALKDYLEKATPRSDREFVISRVFDAPRELVFKAWTEPERMAKWWGPHQFTNPVCELDARPGGKWLILMRGPDGTDHPCKGVYREVTPPARLVMTVDHSDLPEEWHDMINPGRDRGKGRPSIEGVMTVTFDDEAGKTRLTIRTLFETAAAREALLKIGMTEGWSQSLERLGALVATL
jgi:uncharacterized protein YndB with AHSA1/START domain